MQHKAIWDSFCERHRVAQEGVPLFQTDERGIVQTRWVGDKARRLVLCRSARMEERVVTQADRLVEDWASGAHHLDGLIYMMFYQEAGGVVPLYIGKAGTLGKKGEELSVNIKNLRRDRSKFARWGDGYAYHIGDLSAVVLPGHEEKKKAKKYEDWAKMLFMEFPTEEPREKQPTYFWAKAWDYREVGIWQELGSTGLPFLEYLMIGIASLVFPERLLNREGRSREE